MSGHVTREGYVLVVSCSLQAKQHDSMLEDVFYKLHPPKVLEIAGVPHYAGPFEWLIVAIG